MQAQRLNQRLELVDIGPGHLARARPPVRNALQHLVVQQLLCGCLVEQNASYQHPPWMIP
jgi:hypothetical protein